MDISKLTREDKKALFAKLYEEFEESSEEKDSSVQGTNEPNKKTSSSETSSESANELKTSQRSQLGDLSQSAVLPKSGKPKKSNNNGSKSDNKESEPDLIKIKGPTFKIPETQPKIIPENKGPKVRTTKSSIMIEANKHNEIFEDYANGMRQSDLCRKYECSKYIIIKLLTHARDERKKA